MVVEWLFGPRARRWQEVESVFFLFFFARWQIKAVALGAGEIN